MSNLVNHRTAYGKNQPLIDVYNPPIVSYKATGPLVTDKAEIGQIWIYPVTNQVWILTSFLAGDAIWTPLDDAGATGITWITSAAPAIAAAVNHGYVLSAAVTQTVTLPAIAIVGSIIYIETLNAINGDMPAPVNMVVQAAAGDTITQNNYTSSAGGTVTYTSHGAARHSCHLVCIDANTQWRIVHSSRTGNFA